LEFESESEFLGVSLNTGKGSRRCPARLAQTQTPNSDSEAAAPQVDDHDGAHPGRGVETEAGVMLWLHENLRKKSDFTLAKSKLAMWFPNVKRET
jgi:hypothetical protein